MYVLRILQKRSENWVLVIIHAAGSKLALSSLASTMSAACAQSHDVPSGGFATKTLRRNAGRQVPRTPPPEGGSLVVLLAPIRACSLRNPRGRTPSPIVQVISFGLWIPDTVAAEHAELGDICRLGEVYASLSEQLGDWLRGRIPGWEPIGPFLLDDLCKDTSEEDGRVILSVEGCSRSPDGRVCIPLVHDNYKTIPVTAMGRRWSERRGLE